MGKKIMLIDGNSIINRAFYAIPLLTSKDGEFTNGVYGFLNIVFKLYDEEKPDYLAIAFDVPKPTFRHLQFEQYKGTRKSMPDELRPQFPLLKSLLAKMNVEMFELEGFEADDVIGTLAMKSAEMGLETVIVSGDRDMLQLAREDVLVRIPKTKFGKTTVENYYAQDVFNLMGVTPTEFIDVKALMGDVSDNIPGVPGIGEKTALKIIVEYKTIEAAIENADKVKPPKAATNLVEFKEQAILSKQLAAICLTVPIELDTEKAAVGDMFNDESLKEVTRLGFKTLIPRFSQDGETTGKTQGKTNVKANVKAQEKTLRGDVSPITIEEKNMFTAQIDIEQELAMALKADVSAFQFLFVKDKFVGISISHNENNACNMETGESLTEEALFEMFRKYLESDHEKVTADYKKAATYALKFGVKLGVYVFDLMVCAYVLDPLNALDEEFFNGCKGSLGLFNEMKIKLVESKQESLYYNMERPLIDVLMDMEQAGIKINKEELAQFGENLDVLLGKLTSEIYELSGEMFNINSPSQLGVVLFEKLGLTSTKKTKTGYSTAAEVLEKLKYEHEIIPKVLEYRTFIKLKTTYVDGLIAATNKETGKIHTTFNQTITATGRISSTEPNLQNIPIRLPLGKELRKVFVPTSDDYVFLDADYNQIELRILAHMAEDETLINAFKTGQDIHRLTASKVFDVPYDDVTQKQRSSAKAVNFGIVYGIGAFSLSEDLKISRKEAAEYIDGYFEKYPKIKIYLDRTVAEAKENGYSATIFNRRRNILELASSNHNLREFGKRVAMNMPVQGSAADVIKIAMINVHNRLKRENLQSKMLLQVHDELLLEVKRSELEAVETLLKEEMENCVSLLVPMEVDCHVGENWFLAK